MLNYLLPLGRVTFTRFQRSAEHWHIRPWQASRTYPFLDPVPQLLPKREPHKECPLDAAERISQLPEGRQLEQVDGHSNRGIHVTKAVAQGPPGIELNTASKAVASILLRVAQPVPRGT